MSKTIIYTDVNGNVPIPGHNFLVLLRSRNAGWCGLQTTQDAHEEKTKTCPNKTSNHIGDLQNYDSYVIGISAT